MFSSFFWIHRYFLFLHEVGIVKTVKFTGDSECLACDGLLVISKGGHKLIFFFGHCTVLHCISWCCKSIRTGAIIGDGDRKSWDPRGPMIWDNVSIFRTNCAILTSYICANPRTCRGFSRRCCHVAESNVESFFFIGALTLLTILRQLRKNTNTNTFLTISTR